jgi:hypothetical protein
MMIGVATRQYLCLPDKRGVSQANVPLLGTRGEMEYANPGRP